MIINPGLLRFAGKSGSSLVAPGVLRTLSFSRAQVSTISTAVAADGLLLNQFAADMPRFNDSARRLLIEGQRTNLVTNPRSGWGAAGITLDFSQIGPSGIANDATLSTETITSGQHFSAPALFSATAGVVYAGSVFAKPGTTSIIQVALAASSFGSNAWANFDLTGAGALGTVGSSATARIARFGDWYRCTVIATASSAGAASIFFPMIQSLAATRAPSYLGTGVSLTLTWAQLEAGAFASTTILPPVGTPATSTRGADLVSATLASLKTEANGACTVLWSGAWNAINQGADLCAWQIDDGTNANNIRVRVGNGNTFAVLTANTAGGGNINSGVTNPVVAGVVQKHGVTIDGLGQAAICWGGAVSAITGVPVSGLSTLRLGRQFNTSQFFGEVRSFIVLPYALSNTDLQNAVASIPV